MIVLRKTMDKELASQAKMFWDRLWDQSERYGNALERLSALQRQMSAWVLNKAENITPEQAAQMFYAQDDEWQGRFFNCMQDQVKAWHDAQPPKRPGETGGYVGVPAGEPQWCFMSYKLDDSGFETIEAMYEHAKYRRENKAA